jgi:hypothetical protein
VIPHCWSLHRTGLEPEYLSKLKVEFEMALGYATGTQVGSPDEKNNKMSKVFLDCPFKGSVSPDF